MLSFTVIKKGTNADATRKLSRIRRGKITVEPEERTLFPHRLLSRKHFQKQHPTQQPQLAWDNESNAGASQLKGVERLKEWLTFLLEKCLKRYFLDNVINIRMRKAAVRSKRMKVFISFCFTTHG